MSEARSYERWVFYPEHESSNNLLQEQENAQPRQPLSLAMIHGLQQRGDTWRGVCDLLENDFRAICLNLPWSGQEGHSWGSVRSAVEWLRLGLASAPVRPQVLVAHSFGVNVVLEYLQQREVCDLSALILISPNYYARCKDLGWTTFDHLQQSFREVIPLSIQARSGRDRKTDPAIREAMVNKVIDYVGPLGFVETFLLVARTPFLQFQHILIPTLVITGADDHICTPQKAFALAQHMPDSHVEIIPSCHHFPPVEQPETVSRLIQQFLTSKLGLGNLNRTSS